MSDPLSAIGAAASVANAVEAANKSDSTIGGLVTRVFGPAADEIGLALARFTAFRVGNVKRIAEAADRKSQGREGIVPPRLSHSLLDEGSWCDDELMADYLGGVLAAGRTPSGRDDRAVAWSNFVTSMSALQLRAHFIFYREWAIAVHGVDIDLGTHPPRKRVEMYVELPSLYMALRPVAESIQPNEVITHVLTGLSRMNLIENTFASGQVGEVLQAPQAVAFENACRVQMTIPGMELYAWACGIPGLQPKDFAKRAELIESEVDVLRPNMVMPGFSR